MAYQVGNSEFIDFKHDTPDIEDKVLETIESCQRIDWKIIKDSVTNCQLNRNRALYYLTLKSIKDGRLNPYKKKKRSSIIRLDSIALTPSSSKSKAHSNRASLNRDSNQSTPQRKVKINLPTPRLIFDTKRLRLRLSTPESPRRLIDFLGEPRDY